LLFHKDKVVSFSDIGGGSIYEAEKDGGTIKNEYQPIKPQKYLPNQKYNKLKPTQKYANETFEIDLISEKYNTEFISRVESGEIDVNGKWKSQDKSFLEAACWCNNNELVRYLLGKKAKIRYALHQCVGYGNNPEAIELLLEQGADINFPYRNGNTIIFEVVSSMESIYRANDHYIKINRLDLITDANIKKLQKLKEQVQDLVLKGANPNIKNNYGHSCFDIMKDLNVYSKKEVSDFLTMCLKNRKEKYRHNKQWWRFWK
jgi:ankyrin repeat protein